MGTLHQLADKRAERNAQRETECRVLAASIASQLAEALPFLRPGDAAAAATAAVNAFWPYGRTS